MEAAEGLPGVAVHPHSRGELALIAASTSAVTGSSPLAWGVGIWLSRSLDLARFIPTRVGSCRQHTLRAAHKSVHPHSRGELSVCLAVFTTSFGSSPLAWGVGPEPPAFHALRRFIPTRVGSCAARPDSYDDTSVHPHSRGELPVRPYLDLSPHGSSPLAWGVGDSSPVRPRSLRFIPTRVGSCSHGVPSGAS